MAVPYEPIVKEDFEVGYGTVDRTMPAGGTAVGTKVGIHTWLGDFYNVKDFGALGDGIADDKTAIQLAITTAPAGSTIFFPSGTYLLRSGLSVTKALVFKGAYGWNDSVDRGAYIKATVAMEDMFLCSGTGSVQFKNLNLDGNSLANQILHFNRGAAADSNKVINCMLRGALYASVRAQTQNKRGEITGCQFSASVRHISLETNCDSWVIHDNPSLLDSSTVAVNISSSGLVVIANNVFEHTVTGGHIQIVAGSEHVIVGNYTVNVGSATRHILLQGTVGSVVVGNQIQQESGSAATGIQLTGACESNYIDGNLFGGTATQNGLGVLMTPISDSSSGKNRIMQQVATASLQTVASAATLSLPAYDDIFTISGTTNVTSMTASYAGRRVTLIFEDVLTFTDGNNLKLAGNFTTSADDTIMLVCNGTNWYEVSRSAN